MSLKPMVIPPVPEETARVARAAFPKGTLVLRLRDELGSVYQDERFAALYPDRGQPAVAPWRLALVSVLQFVEGLSDRQAAEAVRGRIDWKYALGLELTDPGFDFSVLSEFRSRLLQGGQEQMLLETMLTRLKEVGLVKARSRQRTDSTHVLAAVRTLNRLETVGETLRAALNSLAQVAPDWLRPLIPPDWFDRYGRRVEEYRLPKGEAARVRLGEQIGTDGHKILAAFWPRSTRRQRRSKCAPWRRSRSCGVPGSISSISRRGRCVGVVQLTCPRPATATTPPTMRTPATAISAARPGPVTRSI